jgi:hypothetical protein
LPTKQKATAENAIAFIIVFDYSLSLADLTKRQSIVPTGPIHINDPLVFRSSEFKHQALLFYFKLSINQQIGVFQ